MICALHRVVIMMEYDNFPGHNSINLIHQISVDDELAGVQPDISRLMTIYWRSVLDPEWAMQVIDALAQEKTEVAGSWLLKHHLEENGTLDKEQTVRLVKLLARIQNWQACLHILQSIRFLTIPTAAKKNVEIFVRQGLSDEAKFVRAWAYDAFYCLAAQHPGYLPEAERLLEQGMEEEAPSIKARIRQLIRDAEKVAPEKKK